MSGTRRKQRASLVSSSFCIWPSCSCNGCWRLSWTGPTPVQCAPSYNNQANCPPETTYRVPVFGHSWTQFSYILVSLLKIEHNRMMIAQMFTLNNNIIVIIKFIIISNPIFNQIVWSAIHAQTCSCLYLHVPNIWCFILMWIYRSTVLRLVYSTRSLSLWMSALGVIHPAWCGFPESWHISWVNRLLSQIIYSLLF